MQDNGDELDACVLKVNPTDLAHVGFQIFLMTRIGSIRSGLMNNGKWIHWKNLKRFEQTQITGIYPTMP